MPSIYKKGSKLYMSWYDSVRGKRFNRSLKMEDTETNRRKAENYAKQLEAKLQKDADMLKMLGINKITIKDAFNHFLRNNSEKNLKTIKDYHRFYKKFTESFNEDALASTINKINVEAWLIEIKRLPIQKNSIYAYFKQCRHFLNFLFEYNYTQMFKINRDVRPKVEIKEKIIFANEDLKIIFSGLKQKNDNFKLLIKLLFYTGLRSSDVLTIKSSDINIASRELHYYSPKRKKHRVVGFHKDLVPMLEKFKAENPDGQLLNYASVENLGKAIVRYLAELNLNKKGYSARTFRKTFITLCRESGMDASVVAELVGHEHLSTADRYYNKISVTKMNEELEKFDVKRILNNQ